MRNRSAIHKKVIEEFDKERAELEKKKA